MLRKESKRCLQSQPGFSRQRGAVLITGLVLLFVITLVGVATMESVTLDEKVVSTMQSSTLAYHGAEAALANCESSLQAGSITAFNLGSMPDGWQKNPDDWAHDNVSVVDFAAYGDSVDTKLKSAANCLTEFVGDGGSNIDVKQGYRADNPSSRPVYRVTARSQGGDDRTEVIMESLFVCPSGCESIESVDYSGT